MADRAEKEIRKSHFGKRSKAAETVKSVPANNGTGSVPRSFCMGKTPPDAVPFLRQEGFCLPCAFSSS